MNTPMYKLVINSTNFDNENMNKSKKRNEKKYDNKSSLKKD